MEITKELSTFKETVASKIDDLNSLVTNISDKTNELLNVTNQAKNGFDTNYNSANKTELMSKISTISMILDTINSSLNSDLKPMLNKSQQLINKVEELEKIKGQYDNQVYSINVESNNDEELISTKTNSLANLESSFYLTQTEATNLLIELKTMDETIEFIKLFGSESGIKKLEALNYGTFEKTSFKASNGVVVSYYIYVPENGDTTKSLPIHMFLHGSGEVESGGGALNCGLPKMISDKEVTPSGIVLIPQAIQGGEFYKANYEQALVELIDDTAEKYNGDLDRVSLSGYSNGAYAGYQFVGRYPDTFTAFIPISGDAVPYVIEKMKGSDTKFWIFHGKNDVRVDSSASVRIANQLKNEDVDTQLYIYEDEGHMNIQDYTFNRTFEDSEGDSVYVLDWAMSQTKENKEA